MNTDLIDALVERLKGKLVQTHASWVILTENFAYKVKKPVNFGFLDYSTLEKRRENCHREVELNRRLCPWVYVGVLAVVKVGSEYFLEGEGESGRVCGEDEKDSRGEAYEKSFGQTDRRRPQKVSKTPL